MGRRGRKRVQVPGFGDGEWNRRTQHSDDGPPSIYNAKLEIEYHKDKKYVHAQYVDGKWEGGRWETFDEWWERIMDEVDEAGNRVGPSYRQRELSFEPKAPARGAWTTGEDPMDLCAKDCSWIEKNKPLPFHIALSKTVSEAVKYLLFNAPGEWQILLLGEVKAVTLGENEELKKEVAFIDGYHIPKQEVGPAHVHNLDCIDKEFIEANRVIGTMHSHVDMGAFFSQTDEKDCNSSPLKYHVVINRKLEYQAVKQVALPCGMRRFESATLAFTTDPLPVPQGLANIIEVGSAAGGRTLESGWSTAGSHGDRRVVQHYIPMKE